MKKPASTRSSTTLAPRQNDSHLELVNRKDGPRADSRDLASQLGKAHQSVFELVKDYQIDFEQFGLLRFQTGKATGGRPERFALLNEDQAYLLLTYSRNTAKSRALKIKLVKAFGEARCAAQAHRAEYLPTYHELHDAIHARAAGSPNEKFVHMNVNRLINQAAGVEAGQRPGATIPQQSMLTVAQAVAAQAMKRAPDHRTGFQQTKAALLALTQATMIGQGMVVPPDRIAART